MNKVTGAVVATVVAGLFAANTYAADAGTAKAGKVKCSAVNECKGKGECSAEGHSCAGHNDCKGKGWITLADAKTCTDKKGTVVTDPPKGTKADPKATAAPSK
jgi:uncharacterized membrane protein